MYMDYSPVILKNKGVPTEFAKTQKVGDRWERVLTEDGELVKEERWVKFTNNSISDIEVEYEGLEAWQEKLEKIPLTTVRHTLSIVFGEDVQRVGEAMLDAEVVTYANVIGTAWSIANGVDPTVASRLLLQSEGLAKEQREVLNKELTKSLNNLDSPGQSGSDSGRKPASRSKNSGK